MLVLIDCFKLGNIDFKYKIKFEVINKIILTGGGPFYLNKIHRDFLNKYIKERVYPKIEIMYDIEYSCWVIGHEES